MTTLHSITLDVPDTVAAREFYSAAFDLDIQVDFRDAQALTSGFRGFTMSLVVGQPSTVDGLIGTAVAAGAEILKPPTKSFWGYGGVVRAPDGAIWKVATSSKKDPGPATRAVDEVVLLLGVADVKATKRFYVERGLTIGKSYGSKYVELDTKNIRLALYGRKALAKDAGVPIDGTGSHRLSIVGDAGAFTDPDGFEWATTVG